MTLRLLWFAVVLVPCAAWDTVPHQKITKAALAAAPNGMAARLGAEAGALEQIYCIYPDRYVEMEHYGFIRKSAGPKTAAEIRAYCLRPDGEVIHGITGDRDSDLQSVVFLLEQVSRNLRANRTGEAARYAGVLSHFVADSLSPPHAVSAERLLELAPEPGGINLHSALERSLPDFVIRTVPAAKPGSIRDLAAILLRECYAGSERNRKDLPAMLRAAVARDEKTLDPYRLRAGMRAAEILAIAFAFLAAGV